MSLQSSHQALCTCGLDIQYRQKVPTRLFVPIIVCPKFCHQVLTGLFANMTFYIMCLIVRYKVPTRLFVQTICFSNVSAWSPRGYLYYQYSIPGVVSLCQVQSPYRLPVPKILILNVCTKSLLGSLYQQHGVLCTVEYLAVRYKVPTRLFVLKMLNPKSLALTTWHPFQCILTSGTNSPLGSLYQLFLILQFQYKVSPSLFVPTF